MVVLLLSIIAMCLILPFVNTLVQFALWLLAAAVGLAAFVCGIMIVVYLIH